jgi:hypothetical protein
MAQIMTFTERDYNRFAPFLRRTKPPHLLPLCSLLRRLLPSVLRYSFARSVLQASVQLGFVAEVEEDLEEDEEDLLRLSERGIAEGG